MSAKRWTIEEEAYLRAHYAESDIGELVRTLGRSKNSILGKAYALKLKKEIVSAPRDAEVINKIRETMLSSRKRYNPHPVTQTTEKMICWYTEDGNTVKEIAEMTNRPTAVIQEILGACLADGRYEKYNGERRHWGLFEARDTGRIAELVK